MSGKLGLQLSRRHFLAAGVAGLGALALPSWARGAAAKLRYCAITPETNDLVGYHKTEDLHWTDQEAVEDVTIPALGAAYFKDYRTLLTIVAADGSHVRRVWVPGLLHTGAFWGDQLILVTRGVASVCYALDVETLTITAYALPPEGTLFGGHIIPWVHPGSFALTVNRQQEGAHDRVAIYDGATLKLMDSFSSHGFQAHELALAPDMKTLYVGHYGAYYASGPYQHFRTTNWQQQLTLAAGNMRYFPGAVAAIDTARHALTALVSDTNNGPQGHIAPTAAGDIYLSRFPALLRSHAAVHDNPLFAEGADKACPPEFYNAARFVSSGTTVAYDETAQQYLLPTTFKDQLCYGGKAGAMQTLDLLPHDFRKPSGLAFLPDGRHYVVSCANGFAVLKRGTHELVAERSVRLQLGWHSHMAAG